MSDEEHDDPLGPILDESIGWASEWLPPDIYKDIREDLTTLTVIHPTLAPLYRTLQQEAQSNKASGTISLIGASSTSNKDEEETA